MEVAEVKFEPSGRQGIVAVGTYLIDAAARLGVRIDLEQRDQNYNPDVVKVTKGAELLSKPTKLEIEHLNPERRRKGERLASQAKIEKVGELTVMTTAKPKPKVPPFEQFKKDFAKLPLEDKFRRLVDLESIALNDSFQFLMNLPFYIGEKIRDGLAVFGYKMEEAEKNAKRPSEHKSKANSEPAVAETPKKNRTSKAKTSPQSKTRATAQKKSTTRKRSTKPSKNSET